MTPPVVLHVGFVKTATSTPRPAVFSRHEDLGLGLPAPDPAVSRLIHAIANADSVEFDGAQSLLETHLTSRVPARVALLSPRTPCSTNPRAKLCRRSHA